MNKLDLSVIVLTGNEELHIGRCLDRIAAIAQEVFVIDCFSADRTVEIAQGYDNVTVLQHKWENNYAMQFNWALENAPIKTKWVLRLDADEYLMPELVNELQEKLPLLPDDVTGITIRRRHIFLDRWMKRGIYPVKLLRIFQYGKGMCEQRLMDEHIQLTEGRDVEMEYDFCDHNLNDLSWFCHKHVNYAIREAVDLLDIEIGLTGAAATDDNKEISRQASAKRQKKHSYAHQPLFWRSFAYFIYRYIVKRAFLDGKEGFLFSFIQGWWYRTLVDAKVLEVKKACGILGLNAQHVTDDKRIEIINYIKNHYKVEIPNSLTSRNNGTLGGVILKVALNQAERRAAA